MWLQGFYQLRVELRYKREVRLFLVRAMEDVPGQFVYVPSVEEVDVGESQRNGTFGLGESCDVEIGSEGNGSSNRRL